jgi:cation diffusion facilitator family transporter
VIANAWHHRSDAFSSIGTAIGIGGAILLGDGWQVLDPIAAVIVSFFIMKVAYALLKPCTDELLERSLPKEVEDEISRIVLKEDGVSELHHLRTRRIGGHYAMEMHIRMDGNNTLNEAHHKATAIEQRLKKTFGQQTHIGIHVEPFKIDGHYADIDVYEKKKE